MTLHGKGEIISAHADTVIIDNDTAKTARKRRYRSAAAASTAFSTSSLTALAGLSTTSQRHLIDHCIGKQADGRLFHGLFDCQWRVV